MKYFKRKKVTIPMFIKDTNEDKSYTKYVIGLEDSIVDKTGKHYQVFLQENLEYFKDLRLNNPNIGIIMPDKTFMKICTYEIALKMFNKVREKFETINALDSYNELKQQRELI